MKLILIIIVFILCFILSSRIRIRIYKKEKGMSIIQISLNLLFWNILIKTIDLGKYVKKNMEIYSFKKNLREGILNIKKIIENNHLIKKYIKSLMIDKVTIIIRNNSLNPSYYPFISVINWNIISTIKYLLNTYCKDVDNEYYGVMLNDESKKGMDIELIGSISIFSILKVTLVNLKTIIILLKKEKRNGRNKTYQSVTSNSHEFT